jgi:hypothetical protein
MLSAVSAVGVALRYVLREPSPCVADVLIVKERLEGLFEMPFLSMWTKGMTVERYIELTSALGVKKLKKVPSKGLEGEVHKIIEKEVNILLGKNLLQREKKEEVL